MKRELPDYFIALVKQKTGLTNNQQTSRAIIEISKTIETSLTPQAANRFFSVTPAYLRVPKQTFFAKVGNWQKPVSAKEPTAQLMSRLQLTDQEEAKVLLRAYFAAIQTITDKETQLKASLSLHGELAKLYIEAKALM